MRIELSEDDRRAMKVLGGLIMATFGSALLALSALNLLFAAVGLPILGVGLIIVVGNA